MSRAGEHPLDGLAVVVLARGRGIGQAQKDLHPDVVIGAIKEVIAASRQP